MSRGVSPRLDEAGARSPRMAGRRIGEEFLLVPIVDRGADLDGALSLNRVAAFVWEQLDGRKSGSDVVESVLERFEVERERAEQDYLELIDTLTKVGAVSAAVPRDRAGDLPAAPPLTGLPRGG